MARIQIIKDERDCNRCGRKGCGGDIIRDGKGGIKAHLICPGHTGVQPFRMPLLTLAAQNPGSLTALAPVLDYLGLHTHLSLEEKTVADYGLHLLCTCHS